MELTRHSCETNACIFNVESQKVVSGANEVLYCVYSIWTSHSWKTAT